jgi:hypothetical protein
MNLPENDTSRGVEQARALRLARLPVASVLGVGGDKHQTSNIEQ